MAEYSPNDLQNRDIAIRTIIGEDPSPQGSVGVAAVLLNRLASDKWGSTMDDVVLSLGQFEAWPRQYPELLKISVDDPRYVRAGQILDGLASGAIPDPTNGATHFYGPRAQAALGRAPPVWGEKPGQRLGGTMFYAPEGRISYQTEYPPAKPVGAPVAPSADKFERPSWMAPKPAVQAARPAQPAQPAVDKFERPSWMAPKPAAPPALAALPPHFDQFKPSAMQAVQPPTPAPPLATSLQQPKSAFGEYLTTSAEQLARIPKELPAQIGGNIADIYEAAKAMREQGYAEMHAGAPVAGAYHSVAGYLGQATAPALGLWQTLGENIDPMLIGAEAAPPARILTEERGVMPVAERPPPIETRPPPVVTEGAAPAPIARATGVERPAWMAPAKAAEAPKIKPIGEMTAEEFAASMKAFREEVKGWGKPKAPPTSEPPPLARAARAARPAWMAPAKEAAKPIIPGVKPTAAEIPVFKSISEMTVEEFEDFIKAKKWSKPKAPPTGEPPPIGAAVTAAPKIPPTPTSMVHPKPGEQGQPITIFEPSKATPSSTWHDANKIVTYVPGGPVADYFQPWIDAPKTNDEWDKIEGKDPSLDAKPFTPIPGKPIGAGVVIVASDGRVWVVSPTNKFGGFENTLPKGRVEPGLDFQSTAIKEAFEETGLKVELTAFVGDFDLPHSKTRYYLAKRVGGSPADMGWESQAAHMVPQSQIAEMVKDPIEAKIISEALAVKKAPTNILKFQSKAQKEVDAFYDKIKIEGTHTQLPMDPEARIKRAKEQGFNTDLTLFHGTGASFLRHDLPKGSEPAVFLSDDPKIAGAYAKKGEGSQIIPIWGKMEKPKVVNWGGTSYSNSKMASILKQAKQEGHDVVIIENILDIGSSNPQTQYAFFEPGNLRSQISAAFDPSVPTAKAHLLSAAAAPPPTPLPAIPERFVIREQEDRFNRLRKSATADKAELTNRVAAMPAEIRTPEMQEKFYGHMEDDPTFPLTSQEKMLYDQYVAPLKREELALWEEAKNTDLEVVDYDPQYAHRIRKGLAPHFDALAGETTMANPIGGMRSLPRTTSSMRDRIYFAIQGFDGTRKLVARDPETGVLRIIEKGMPATPIKLPKDFKPGDNFMYDGQGWTLTQAKTREIEANTDIEYYKNAVANTVDNIARLRVVVRAIHEVKRLTSSPEWQTYARRVGEKDIPSDWRVPAMPLFHGWRVEPKLANVIDDFYGNTPFLPEALAKINRFAVITMFFAPFVHIGNVAVHWTVARGWDWIKPEGIKSLAVDGATALREVVTQGPKYQQTMRQGSGLIYGAVANQEFYKTMMRRLGEDIKRKPAQWDPIARTLGIGPSDLIRMLYAGSNRALWAASDVFMMQRVLELERKGLSTREAIAETERHIPGYRMPSEVWQWTDKLAPGTSRFISRVLQDPSLTEFSRYHYTMLNSFAHMAQDLFGRPGKNPLGESRRIEAIGNFMALAVVSTVVFPATNWAIQQVTGNKNLRLMPRGALTPVYPFVDWSVNQAARSDWVKKHAPSWLLDYYNNDSDFLLTIANWVAIAPVLRAGLEMTPEIQREFFSGRSVAEPADVHAHRWARVIGQESEHLAKNLAQPYDAAARALRQGKNPLVSIIEGGLGVSEPDRTGRAKVAKWQEKAAIARQKKPEGPLEELFNVIERKLPPWLGGTP